MQINNAPKKQPAVVSDETALPFVIIADGAGRVAMDLRKVTMIMHVPLQGMIVTMAQGPGWSSKDATADDMAQLFKYWQIAATL